MPIHPKVFATGRLPQHVQERLSQHCDFRPCDKISAITEDELLANIKGVDAVVCLLGDALSAPVMDKCPSLKLIANVAVGFDNIDIAAATSRGILVINTPGVLDNATADLTIGLLLAVARRIVESDRYVRAGKWQGWNLDFMIGSDTFAKTLGIIGMGRIGEAVAKRARAFGMRVVYSRQSSDDVKDMRLRDELGAERVSFEQLLRDSDYISVHCPLNQHTRHLLAEEQFSLMKRDCILINTSRGAVIDQKALIAALKSNMLKGAGLDVFEDEPAVPEELLSMENVVLTPHIGSACFDTRRGMAELAVDGLLKSFAGELPHNTVNKDAWKQFQKRTQE